MKQAKELEFKAKTREIIKKLLQVQDIETFNEEIEKATNDIAEDILSGICESEQRKDELRTYARIATEVQLLDPNKEVFKHFEKLIHKGDE